MSKFLRRRPRVPMGTQEGGPADPVEPETMLCPECKGDGRVLREISLMRDGSLDPERVDCTRCGGSGRVPEERSAREIEEDEGDRKCHEELEERGR